MRQIADFHIHSRYSRACSRDLTLQNIEKTCRTKGLDIIGTGDFTYPLWFESIKNDLEEIKLIHSGKEGDRRDSGLYKLKSALNSQIKFILTTEVALIYKKGERTRRIHIVIHAPNVLAVAELNKYLDKNYNIRSDGRPILGMSVPELCRLCFSVDPGFIIYPAHIWTPWFSVFGSKSGFDSMEECFEEYTDKIVAYETGLSSDPEMNWRVSALDHLTLLSNSDAHSLPNLGREANVFEFAGEVSYDSLYNAIANKKPDQDNKLLYTIEFYPEEGMYHWDGHRDCGVRFSPAETKKNKGICPKCKKNVVIGVDYRVDELADRAIGYKGSGRPGFKKIVELDKIIAEALNIKSRKSVKVLSVYSELLNDLQTTELDVLMNVSIEKIKEVSSDKIAEGVRRVREGELIVEPGYDGEYGVVKIFKEREKDIQKKLF